MRSLIVISLLLFVHLYSYAQVDATFQIDSSSVKSYEIRVTSQYQMADTATHNFLWEFGDGIQSVLPNAIHVYSNPGNYRISLRVTEGGSFDQSFQDITIKNLVEVPNVFTPNNDGINDFLVFRTNGVDLYSVEIFSSSGSLVFKQSSYTIMWDGKNPSGKDVHPGVYYYTVELDGKYIANGFLHLIR